MSRGARQKASDRFKLYVLLWNLEGGSWGWGAGVPGHKHPPRKRQSKVQNEESTMVQTKILLTEQKDWGP